MGIIDKFDDTVRLNLRRFGLTALPLFSVTVALNAPLEVALLCGTSCSALALLGSRPAKIRSTVGRQMYRTAQYIYISEFCTLCREVNDQTLSIVYHAT